MFIHLDKIPACDGQTDGFFHGIVRAMHMRRAVKIHCNILPIFQIKLHCISN